MQNQSSYSVFEGDALVLKGPFAEVIQQTKKRMGKSKDVPLFIFSDSTGKTVDFNFQGTQKDVEKRLSVYVTSEVPDSGGRGRPKLGVISREVSLLPRHWEWLATQSGGASATLRRLVEEAKKSDSKETSAKQAQERTYQFMMVMAGNLQGYEEALRALYKKDKSTFTLHIRSWPKDIRNYALELAKPAIL